MDGQPSNIPIPDGVAVTSPAPVAAMSAPGAEAQQAPAMTPAPVAAGGTTDTGSGDSVKDFFKSINWLEAGFSILAALGLYYTIYYYRFRIKESKVSNSDVQRQLDELKMNVQGAMKGKYQQL
jgi:hypothetical protein